MKTFDDPAAIPPKLDLSKVPEEFHSLAPLAERYGVGDDIYREEMVESLTDHERTELIEFLDSWDDRLDTWLAGAEADSRPPSDEYCTFTCLRMAADSARIKNT
ncbi:hypothetical protein [Haloferula sp.]|uniref:hypothetical protein n=1 Tax=Haloferula sp. TaxID=2497595 RepID=UPI003C75F306